MKNNKSSLIQTIPEKELQNWGQRPWEKKSKQGKSFHLFTSLKIISQIVVILLVRAFKTIAFTQKCHS
jgi:hypothetical protein